MTTQFIQFPTEGGGGSGAFLKLDGTNSPTATIDFGGQSLTNVKDLTGSTGNSFNIANVHMITGYDDGVNGPVVNMNDTYIDSAAGIEFVSGHTAQITTKTADFDLNIVSLNGRINMLRSGGTNGFAFLDTHATSWGHIVGVSAPDIGSLDGTGTDGLRFANLFLSANIRIGGNLGVGNSASATTPGTVVKKIEVFNTTGTSLGFIPVYNAIS